MLLVEYKNNLYQLSPETPKDGDLVMTEKYGVWEFKQAPCPIPFWGNPNACSKIIAVNGIDVTFENRKELYKLQFN